MEKDGGSMARACACIGQRNACQRGCSKERVGLRSCARQCVCVSQASCVRHSSVVRAEVKRRACVSQASCVRESSV
eukprot:6178059-Pleurochrysis_carterae.AAC.2